MTFEKFSNLLDEQKNCRQLSLKNMTRPIRVKQKNKAAIMAALVEAGYTAAPLVKPHQLNKNTIKTPSLLIKSGVRIV